MIRYLTHSYVLWALFMSVGPFALDFSFGQTPMLSKEYIYLGDRIIAVESISSGPILPSSLVATAVSTTHIDLTWPVPASGTPDHYGIWRFLGGSWSRIGVAPSTTFSDTTVSPNTAYLYKVAFEDASNNALGESNVDIATTVMFTDDQIIIYSTVIRAVHVEELRTAVNAVRAAAGLGGANWTNGNLAGAWIQSIDVTELRSNLNPALSSLGLSIPNYTDTALAGVTIKKIHFEELRQRVE